MTNNLLRPNERLDDLQYNNLFIIQDPEGYCFTSDAVSLANFVKGRKNHIVVDLCSGSGIIGILVQSKNLVKYTYLVEIQQRLADMSKRSILYNKLENIEVLNFPLQNIYTKIGSEKADIVTCNPPYQKENTSLIGEKEEIAIAKHEILVTFDEIVREAEKLLKFGGKFYTINKEDRMIDMISICRKYNLEPKRVKIIPSKKGSNVIMLECVKGGKCGFKIEL